jgi:hypothetical protein
MVSSWGTPSRGATLRARAALTITLLLAPWTARADHAVEAAVALFREHRAAEASAALYPLADDPNLASEDRSRARYYLARSLNELGLTESAQLELVALMAAGPSDPYFRHALPGLLDLARGSGDPTPLLTVIDLVEPAAQPPRAQPSVRYLQGLGAWQRGEHTRAEELLGAVPDDSELYPRARLLQGLALQELGEARSATAAYQDVIRAEPADDRAARIELGELQALATLQLGRIYDDLGDAAQAEAFYARVALGTRTWDDAMEAMARIDLDQDEPRSALKRSAAAADPIIPTSLSRVAGPPRSADILHARALVALCRPAEAAATLRRLEHRALPLWTELARATAAHRGGGGDWLEPASAWVTWIDGAADGAAVDDHVRDALLERDDLVAHARRLRRLQQERSRIEGQDAAWRETIGLSLMSDIEAEITRTRTEAGRDLLDAMADIEAEQGALLEQAEAERAAVAATTPCEPQPAEPTPADPDAWSSEQRAPPGTQMSWPFTGEIWADEL